MVREYTPPSLGELIPTQVMGSIGQHCGGAQGAQQGAIQERYCCRLRGNSPTHTQTPPGTRATDGTTLSLNRYEGYSTMMHRCPGDLLCFIQIWPHDPPMLLQTIGFNAIAVRLGYRSGVQGLLMSMFLTERILFVRLSCLGDMAYRMQVLCLATQSSYPITFWPVSSLNAGSNADVVWMRTASPKMHHGLVYFSILFFVFL